MKTSVVRIGIAGCGIAARIHLDRLLAFDGVAIVGCADPDPAAAAALADRASTGAPEKAARRSAHSPTIANYYRPSPPMPWRFSVRISALSPVHGCVAGGMSRFYRETPLHQPARGGRHRQPRPRTKFESGSGPSISSVPEPDRGPESDCQRDDRPVTAGDVHSRAALADHPDEEQKNWRQSEKLAAGGILADAGDHLIDALLWTTGQVAVEVAAIQSQTKPGIDLVTAAAIRLTDGTPVSLAVSGVSPGSLFALDYFGELGRLHVSDQTLEEERFDTPWHQVALPASNQTIDGNFVAALANDSPLCCPADQALDTVRLLEAITRSAATGQIVRLV